MRIGLVSHAFPPARLGGTEVYTEAYARALARAGHDVFVFTAEKNIAHKDLSVHEGHRGPLHVTRITNNLFLESFRETFDRPALAPAYRKFLDRAKPDLVHVMHLIDVGGGLVRQTRDAKIPVGFTLHDYWFSCPRWGQRYHPSGEICDVVNLKKCAECLTSFPWRQPPGASGAARGLRWLHENFGLDLATPTKRVLRAARARVAPSKPPAAQIVALEKSLEVRQQYLRSQVVPFVDLFHSPSRFLAAQMHSWGIAKKKLFVSTIGIETESLLNLEKSDSNKIRVAFHGSLMATKAPDLLLQAWPKIPASVRSRATLTIRGAAREPAYLRKLQSLARECGAKLESEFARIELPAKLAETDLLVVPSIWWENSPISILEGLAARTPLVVSDLGGMAELVEEGRGGYRFRPGDAADLARVLRECLTDPHHLARCVAHPIHVRTIDEDARELPRRILEAHKS
jgi:glycosyltransferase involved in cell wall biosynthesis